MTRKITLAAARIAHGLEVSPKYFSPSEVEQLMGDSTKAKTLLGWNPTKTSFEELVKIMVRHDMELVK